MTLFEECLVALGSNAIVLSPEATVEIFDSLVKIFPMTPWGRIDWENVKHSRRSSYDDIKASINQNLREVYILWDEASLPVVKINIENVLRVIDDVKSVSFDTWIYCPKSKYVIEFYHDGEINIGWQVP